MDQGFVWNWEDEYIIKQLSNNYLQINIITEQIYIMKCTLHSTIKSYSKINETNSISNYTSLMRMIHYIELIKLYLAQCYFCLKTIKVNITTKYRTADSNFGTYNIWLRIGSENIYTNWNNIWSQIHCMAISLIFHW